MPILAGMYGEERVSVTRHALLCESRLNDSLENQGNSVMVRCRIQSMESFTFSAYGLQISSAIELPLPRISSTGKGAADNSGGDRPADVVIRFGDVPTALENPVTSTPVIQVTSREFLFSLPGVGRFRIQDGRDVCVHCETAASESTLGLHLAHTGLAAVLFQLGKLPLHASGVLSDGGCVAFLGGSYAGKSTMAAALCQRGCAALCDDICAVTVAEGIATVSQGTGRLELWADAAKALGLSPESAPRAHPEGERYGFPTDLPALDQPIPLRRLYILREAREEPEEVSRLTEIEAFKYLFCHTYFTPHIAGWADNPIAFGAYAAIARSVPIFVWHRQWGLDRLAATADCLENHLKSSVPEKAE